MIDNQEKQQQKTSLVYRVSRKALHLVTISHIYCFGLVGLSAQVNAGTCSNSADPLIITSNCLELSINSAKSELRVDSSGWLGTGSPNYQAPLYITSASTLTQLNNYGVIIAQTPIISGVNAILIDSQSSIGELNNYNLIQADKNAISISSGSITTLNNYGTIKGGSAVNDHGIYLSPNSVGMPAITTINNFGTIGGYGAGIFLDTNNTGLPGVRIDAITNDTAGSISGANLSGIVVGSNNSIGVITNRGMIESTVCPGGSCAHGIENWGTISRIDNQDTGTIQGVSLYGGIGYGIYNRGVIASAVSANDAINNAGIIDSILNAGTIGDASLINHAVVNSGTINLISNSNSSNILGSTNAIQNLYTITRLENSGNLTGRVAISNGDTSLTQSALIDSIVNSGTIQGSSSGGGAGIRNSSNGTINSIENSGTINAHVAIENNAPSGGLSLIDRISNTGTISGQTNAISNSSLINTISNTGSGSMTSVTSSSIQNLGTIGEILNSASISGASNGIHNTGQGVIGLINNTSGGNIQSSGGAGFGIYNNAAQIDLLINAQNPLTYKGTLPLAYNVFINSPSSYGVLAISNPVGTTNFNIAPGSSVANTVYTGVVTGVTSPSFQALTGTYVSGIIRANWNLVNSTGTTTSWDLSAVPVAVVPVVNVSHSATQVAQAITFAYTAIIPNPGGTATSSTNPILFNGSTFTAAAAVLTTAQVNQLVNVHAEGYSSNMTIGLEQMAMISNSVLDRIHQPVSNTSSSSKAYQVDGGRNVWGDILAFKGQVNDQNNLSGFGYNATNILLGSDIFRDKTGGFGVYGGVGYTSMTESSQVVQKFNNTTYTAGIYGGYYLPQDMKISGAMGYVFGNTRADRMNPSIGNFTGGTAHSEFNTNGGFAALKLSKAILVNDRWTINPYVGSSYTQQWNNDIQETGGKDFNYSIASASSYALRTFIGADFNYPLLNFQKTPLSFVGFYRLSYNWTADKDSAHSIKATSPIFGTFNQTGANMGPVSNLFGLGLQGNINSSTSLRVGVVSSINSNGYQVGGGGELRISF